LLIIALSPTVVAADLNVLIVGTSKDATDYSSTYGNSKAFDITKVRTELEKILTGAGMGTVQVSLHDFKANYYPGIFGSGGGGNQLISEFYNKNIIYPPISSDFWKELRGENGTDWDYVILMDEPNTIENFPGFYTLGVSEVGKEVAKGGAETVLLMTWPGNGSTSTVNHYKEVVYRTGRSLGYKVVPAGLAWEAQGSVYGTTHPTNDGAYIAASAIYSRVWGVEGGLDQSAAASTYTYNDTLANAVHQTVKDNKGKVQYTGAFVHPSNVFKQINDRRREWKGNGANSSTENGLKTKLMVSGREAGMDIVDLGATGPDGVFVARDADSFDNSSSLSSKFIHPGTPPNSYTTDSFINIISQDVGSNVRTSSGKLGSCPTYRHLPQPALVAQADKELPDAPFIEGQHGGRIWGSTAAAYWHTLNSGRCAMIPWSVNQEIEEVCYRVGYETAWRMSTLQGRAPGFKVMPSSWKRHEVDPVAPETMTVRFMLPPKQNVTVNISTDVAWATVSPSTLTFTPQNYNTPQNVTVSVTAEAASRRGSLFNVVYSTSSTDEVYHNLSDSWEYGVNTLPIGNSQTVTMQANQSQLIGLTSVDPDVISRIVYATGSEIPKQNISYSIVQAPTNGTVVLNGALATYTPDLDFSGTDSFTFKVFDGLDYSVVNGTVTINVVAKGQYNMNLIINPGAEYGLQGWTGNWASILNQSGNLAVGTPHSGAYSFKANTTATTVEFYQDVDLSEYSNHINAGLQSFHLSGWGNDKNRDDARLVLQFRDSNGQIIGTPYESARIAMDAWKYVETTLLAPPNAVVARVILRGTRLVDTKNLCHFDDLSLKAIKPANMAPVAVNPPQASIAMNVPTVIPLSATDADRFPSDVLTYETVSAPQNGSITGWQNGFPIYTPNTGFLGTDSFTFRVFDGQVYSNNTATASIEVRANRAPSIVVRTPVMPTSNTIYMAATNGIIFETTITDDGGPYPSNLTINWQQVSGPNSAVFGTPNAASTTCNWGDMNDGTYVFRVTANDGEYQTTKNFTVEVLNGGYGIGPNVAPQVDVGGPYAAAVAGQLFTLRGANLSDDGEPVVPGVTVIQWQKIAGPGTVSFVAPSYYETDVVFDTPGIYVLRLTGDDGQIKSYEDLVIQVVAPTPPSVNAGNDQTAVMSKRAPNLTGAYFEWDAAKDTPGDSTWSSSTTNTYTWTFDSGALSPVSVSDARFDKLGKAHEFPAAKDVSNTTWHNLGDTQSATFEFVVDVDADNGLLFETGAATGLQFDISGGALRGCIKGNGTYTVSYPLTATDKSRFIHAVFVITINNKFELYVDGALKQSVTIATTDWSGNEPAGLGNSSSTAPNGNKVDFTGKLALFRYYRNLALSAAQVTTNFESLTNDSAVVNLNGVVTQGAIASPAIQWTVTSGDTSKVAIANASSAVTTARFSQSGTYVLTLTANDGFTQVSDSVTIKINSPPPSSYLTWADSSFANPFTDTAMDSNPDGDSRDNLMEFAFGTDPTRMDMGPLAINGSRLGDPAISQTSEGGFELYFIRRRDGSVTCTACFSHDLTTFEDSNAGLEVVITINSEYELVKVPFPNALQNGQPGRFGRIRLEVTP
jgi:Bacterial Ig domain